ncbi:MAG: hypothetical protein Q7U91_12305 [Sideroxyarcus sp.]|nr:hypothetical protein [Sideroxyarcus sp.]
MKFVIALALLAALILLYRRWVRASRLRYLDQFEIPAAVLERTRAKRPELTQEQMHLVQQGLQQYFRICVAAGGRFASMPSQAVDDLWHEFILFTRQYEQFCKRALGDYLHHTPVEAMPTRDTATEGIRRTWRLACNMEGIDPKHPQRLPLLFALDAQLGIAGGFIYTLNCKDAAASSGGAFCASHIGSCGGDSGGGDSGSSDGGSSCGSGCGGGGD